MSELLASLLTKPEPVPEPEYHTAPDGQPQPLQQQQRYVCVRDADVHEGCDEAASRLIGRLTEGTIITVHARVAPLSLAQGLVRVCFQSPRLSLLQGPNQWASLRSSRDGAALLEQLPRLAVAGEQPPPLPWEGCEGAFVSFGEEQMRQMLCELSAEGARRKVAMLMVELSNMERMKTELQLLKTTTREQQRQLEAATAAAAETAVVATPPAVGLPGGGGGQVDLLGRDDPPAVH